MDLHRKPQPKETRLGRDCQFCRTMDPEFEKRAPMDRLILRDNDSAQAHLTENGYIEHRLLEISLRTARAA